MNWAVGALIGFAGGGGLLLAVLATPPLRRFSLADRIAPYLLDRSRPAGHAPGAGRSPITTVRRLLAPLLSDAVRLLDRIVGGRASVRRRLVSLDSPLTVEQFRIEQVLAGAVGTGIGIALSLLLIVTGRGHPILLLVLIAAAGMGGILARDWWLSHCVARRHAEVIAEFPVVAEMMAIAVTAGEGPLSALARVSRLLSGHLATMLAAIVADAQAGTPFQDALAAARDRTQLEALSRFFDGLSIAVDRGTPLADVLRAQAADVRAMSKRQLLESGGRKEIFMMLPVVFVILPVTILFAFFPGIVAITTVAQ